MTLILPVTAALIRLVLYSLSVAIWDCLIEIESNDNDEDDYDDDSFNSFPEIQDVRPEQIKNDKNEDLLKCNIYTTALDVILLVCDSH